MLVRVSFREAACEEYRRGSTRLLVGAELRVRITRTGGGLAVNALGALGAMRVARRGWFFQREVCRGCAAPLLHRMLEERVPIPLEDPNDGARLELVLTAAVNRCGACGRLHLLDVEEATELVLDYLSTCDFPETGALPTDRTEWLARRARVERTR